MRRVFRGIALCLCALAVLCSCERPDPRPTSSEPPAPTSTAGPAPRRTRFSLGYDPTASLHPITGDSQVNQELTGLVYQGLYELDNTFTPQPVLAKSAQASESAQSWTFTLAEGAVFSDGTPLTAGHVAASLNQARNSPLYAARLEKVTSVTAGRGGDEVHITLSSPNGNLPALLDIPIVLEQGTAAAAPLGTGYYQYEWLEDELYLLANLYHPSAASLPYDIISLTPMSDTGARIAAFDSGEISAVITDFSAPYAPGYSGGYETTDYPTASLMYVGFNSARGVCRSSQVRQAFSRALDRVGMVEVLLAGHGDPAALPVSPLCGEYSQDYAALLEYDPDAAAQLLAQAGYVLSEEDGLLYSRNTPLEVTLLVNSDNNVRQDVARQFADALTQLGVTVTVSHLPWEDFTAALNAGRFDLYIGEVRLTGDFDPSALLTGELNYGGFESRAFTQALNRWRSAREDERAQAAVALWERFVQDAPIASVCFKRGSLLVRWGMASNVRPTRANPYYQMEQWTVAE